MCIILCFLVVVNNCNFVGNHLINGLRHMTVLEYHRHDTPISPDVPLCQGTS